MKETILLIDGSSLIFRAFYALPPLTNQEGIYTNAVYGFLTMYEQLMGQFTPEYLLVAFDRPDPTFRHQEYDAYKGTRDKAPDELAGQFGLLKEVLDAMQVNQIDMSGYEADDILGTLAKQAKAQGYRAVLVTGDRDYLQLVEDDIEVYLTKKGIKDMHMYDVARIQEEYGIEPKQLIDVKGLMGDKSDNIPGIPGIGEKKALGFIQSYGSIEGLYEHVDEISGKKTKEVIIENQQQALMSKRLGEIILNVPMDTDVTSYVVKEEKEQETLQWFERLGFSTLIKKRTQDKPVEKQEPAAILEPKEAAAQLRAWEDPLYFFLLFDHENYTKGKAQWLCFGNGEKAWITSLIESDEPLRAILEDDAKRAVTFDAKEAFYAARKLGIDHRAKVDDLMLAQYLNDPGQVNSTMEQLARNVAGLQLTDTKTLMGKGKQKMLLAEIPEDVMGPWVTETLGAMHALEPDIFKTLEEREMKLLYEDLELPLADVLADMEFIGFPVDAKTLEELHGTFDARIQSLMADIYDAAGEEFNINSTKQLGKILFEDLALPVIKKTKTGYSTDVEVLEALQDSHPIVQHILEYRQLQKLQSTYVEGLLDAIHEDGRIHTTFKQTIAATGRLTSTEPNIQNIPVRSEEGRLIRKAFTASEGNTLLDADYSQIELRILAHLAGDENMIHAFEENIDIHTKTASEVFDVPLDDVTSLMRSRAKAVNFGIVYGISDYGLSRDLKINRKEAKEYIDNYLDSYPSIKAYMDDIIADCKQKGYVQTIWNRRRYVPELTSKNRNVRGFGERIALNTPIQGSAADVIKLAMLEVHRRLKEEKLQSKLLLQVHDELIIDTVPEEKEKVTAILEEVMPGVAELQVPLDVDVNSGDNWYDAK